MHTLLLLIEKNTANPFCPFLLSKDLFEAEFNQALPIQYLELMVSAPVVSAVVEALRSGST